MLLSPCRTTPFNRCDSGHHVVAECHPLPLTQLAVVVAAIFTLYCEFFVSEVPRGSTPFMHFSLGRLRNPSKGDKSSVVCGSPTRSARGLPIEDEAVEWLSSILIAGEGGGSLLSPPFPVEPVPVCLYTLRIPVKIKKLAYEICKLHFQV